MLKRLMHFGRDNWLLVVAAVFFAALTVLLFNMVLDKGAAAWVNGLLVVLGLVVVLATLVSGNLAFDQRRPLQSIKRPTFVAGIFLAIFAGFSVLVDVASLISPRPAVESSPGRIEDIVFDTNERIARMSPDRGAIIEMVRGRWGETLACGVAYEIEIIGDGIRITRDAPELPDFEVIGTIRAETDESLLITIQRPQRARGSNLDLLLEDDGITRRLVWDDPSMSVPLKLEHCEESEQ